MTDESRVTALTDIFQDLADTSGGYERTKIMPNLTVVDAAPADLPANYIIVRNDEGFYIPALKVAGITYTNGDLVNVLFIKGTEPIAFQQGSGSGSSGYALHISDEGVAQGLASTLDFVGAAVSAVVAAGVATITVTGGSGWPFTHVLTVSTTNPNADYANLADAVTAAASGDTIELGSETFTLPAAISTNKSLKFRGQGMDRTVVYLTGAGYALTFTGAVAKVSFDNIRILHDGAASGGSINMQAGAELVILNSIIESQTFGATTSIAIACDAEIPVYVIGSRIIGTAGIGGTGIGINFAALATPHVFADSGSIFTGTTAIKTLTAGGEILLSGPHLAGALSLVGDWFGWYVDSSDDVIIKSYRADVRLHEASSGLSIDYTTIQGAIDAMAAGDIIEVGAGTDTGGIVPDTAGAIVGLSPVETIITASANDSITVDNSAGTDNLTLENLTVANTGAGTSIACIQSNKDGLRLYELVINKVSGTPTNSTGVSVYGGSGTGTYLRNCKITVSTGTNKYGIYASTAACNIVIEGGEINAATADIYVGHASAVIELRGVKLLGGGINNASGGTVKGWYLDANDNLYVGIGGNAFVPAARDLYQISASVAGNNLTVALKSLDGGDPSTSEIVAVKIGNTIRVISGALSTTKNAGTNWCNAGSAELATQDTDYFVYLIQETGASAGTKIGFSRVPYARVMGDFSSTSTNEAYIAGSWTNKNATDEVTLIGRFNAILSAGAGYTWSIGTAVIVNRSIYESRWLAFTPAVASVTGTITTVGATSGAYQVSFNKLFFNQNAVITTNGTGASAVNVSLPFTPVSDNSVCSGRENALTGKQLQGFVVAANMRYFNYDNTYPGGNGAQILGGGISLRLV